MYKTLITFRQYQVDDFMEVVGHVRVSTREQDLGLQSEKLEISGCTKIFIEKQSGAKSHR